jgi:hypothetical protein
MVGIVLLKLKLLLMEAMVTLADVVVGAGAFARLVLRTALKLSLPRSCSPILLLRPVNHGDIVMALVRRRVLSGSGSGGEEVAAGHAGGGWRDIWRAHRAQSGES